MSDRQIYGSFLCVVICIFATLAYALHTVNVTDVDRDMWRNTVIRLEARCQQDAAGAGVCPAGTFTTTTVPR